MQEAQHARFLEKSSWSIRREKMRVFLPARALQLIPCLFHVWTLTGACPTHRRQWADFLAALTALPHRHYKTARTETRRHLLLKSWQMMAQTSASRGYVLFSSVARDTRESAHCLWVADTPAECSKLGKTRIIEDANIRLVRNAIFFDPNFHLHFHLKSRGVIF